MSTSGNMRDDDGKSRGWKPLRLTVGCILLVVIVAIGGMIVHSVRRPGPTPTVRFLSLIEVTQDEGNAAARDRLVRGLCPFPDISQLPADFHDEVREWNKEAEELASRIIEFLPTTKNMTCDKADSKLREMLFESANGMQEEIVNTLPADLWQTVWGGKGYLQTYEEIRLAIWVQHENWHWAAVTCSELDDWDSERYYLQMCGPAGSLDIVARSYERIVNSINESRFGPEKYKKRRYDF